MSSHLPRLDVVIPYQPKKPHQKYRRQYCPKAKIIFNKFHVVKSFNETMNESRKFIIKAFALTKSEKKKLMVKFKYLLAKRSSKRNELEKQSLAEPADANKLIIQLERIKGSVLARPGQS